MADSHMEDTDWLRLSACRVDYKAKTDAPRHCHCNTTVT